MTTPEQFNDGGPAFPKSDCIEPDMEPIRYGHGMTIREYFAAAALQGMMANPECNAMAVQDVARNCYRISDAMLAERKEGA
jgi:hypothetical protein